MIDLHVLSTGVVQPLTDNTALTRLASILGNNLVFGVGALADNEVLLVNLSTVLSPVYLAVLMLILTWVGIGGTAKTAMDGEFLGKDWHSLMVPASILLSVLMLSPVSSQKGITFAQVVFVRAVAYGSNFADLVLKEAVEAAERIAANETDGTIPSTQDPAVRQNIMLIEQTHKRMVSYLPAFLCAESEIAMGQGNTRSFFLNLSATCKIPAGSVYKYNPYYTYTPTQQGSLDPNPTNPLPAVASPSKPTPNEGEDGAKEYSCYYDALEQVYLHASGISNDYKTGLLPGEIAAVTVPKWALPPKQPEPGALPRTLTSAEKKAVSLNPELMRVGWPIAVSKATDCLGSKMAKTEGFLEWLNPWSSGRYEANGEKAWSHGWAKAGDFTKEILANGNAVAHMEPLVFVKTTILQPTLQRIPQNSERAVQLSLLMTAAADLTPALDQLMQGLRTIALKNPASSHGDYTDARKVANVSAQFGLALYQSRGLGGALEYTTTGSGRVIPSMKFNDGVKMWQSLDGAAGPLGPVSMKLNARLGGGVRALGSFAKAAWTFMEIKVAASEALKSNPITGSVGAIAKSVLSFAGKTGGALMKGFGAVMSMPGVDIIVMVLMLVVNTMSIVPEIVIAIALLLWLMRVVAWFLVLPISALVVAIPNARSGSTVWKEGLALALTPPVTILFFLTTLMLQDILVDVATQAMFSKYVSNGFFSSSTSILIDLFSGEGLYRLVGFCGLLVTGFYYSMMLVLKGPNWAFGKMGLFSGDDLTSASEMEGSIKGSHSGANMMGRM
jgi:hypothetical protein